MRDWPTMTVREQESAKHEFVEAIMERVGSGQADTITYGELEDACTTAKFNRRDKRVDHLLTRIAVERASEAGCIVTAVVVHEDDQTPGGAFFDEVVSKVEQVAPELNFEYEDKQTFFLEQLGKAVAYWRSLYRSEARNSNRQ